MERNTPRERNTPMELRYDKLGPKVVKALEGRAFEAYYCATREEALERAKSLIPKGHVVSWGGSMSIQEIGLMDYVKENGYQVIDRDTAKTPEERVTLMKQALGCGTFLMSSNAVSEDGQLVNIDGNGNRVAALCYGPDSVLVIVGMNKVVKSVEDAFRRARTIAAPANAQRFPGAATPCAVNGACGDCTSEDCICSFLVTTRMCRPAKRIKVILVGEHLGL